MEALVHVEFPRGTGLFYLQRRFVFALVEWFSKRMRMLTTAHVEEMPLRNWVENVTLLCLRSDLAVVAMNC